MRGRGESGEGERRGRGGGSGVLGVDIDGGEFCCLLLGGGEEKGEEIFSFQVVDVVSFLFLVGRGGGVSGDEVIHVIRACK